MTVVNAFQPEEVSSRKPHDGTTSIYIVLDETGSMSRHQAVTISSFNEYIQTQQAGTEECRVSLVTFSSKDNYFGGALRSMSVKAAVPMMDLDNKMQTARESGGSIRKVFIEEPVASVPALSTSNYRPSGGTNLYDAIGETITTIDAQLADKETVPNILVVIFTDGEENASREYNLESIRSLIKAREELGWTFVYMGANQDAWQVGASFGLAKGQTMTYSMDALDSSVKCLAESTMSYRSARTEVYAASLSSGDLAADGLVGASAVSRNFFNNEESK